MKALPVVKGNYQLKDYDRTAAEFNWTDAEKEFSWYESGKMNIAYEAVDRHAESFRKNKVALYYKDAERKESYTYNEMKKMSNKAANVLRNQSTLEKGDRLFVFMPRSPELYFSLLGALKLGVIVGPLFEAFMEGAIFDRLFDSEAKAIVTTPELLKRVPIEKLPHLQTIFLVGEEIEEDGNIIDFNTHLTSASQYFDIEWMEREDATLLHYTSGSTGKPKGIVLVQEAMVQQLQTTRWVLDLNDEDVFWCTADPDGLRAQCTVYSVLCLQGLRFSSLVEGFQQIVGTGQLKSIV